MTGEDLINTKFLPPGYGFLLESAKKAKAYHALDPYPKYGFKNWKTEGRGPFPKCSPCVRQIVKQSALWLFGKPVTFAIDGDKKYAEFINEVWSCNHMPGRAVAMAELAGQSGAIVLKGTWIDGPADNPAERLKINVLDAVEQCRLYYDPQDESKLLMGRIQYPYFDAVKGNWMVYREEWTDKFEIKYEPLPLEKAQAADTWPQIDKAEVSASWTESGRKENKFGVVPMVQVKNREEGYWHGVGDLWRLYSAIDALNLSYDLAHKDDQLSVYPKKVYIDLEEAEDEAPLEDGPGSEQYLQTVNGAPSQGSVQYLEAQGAIREHLQAFSAEWKQQIFDCAGSVDLKADAITNKGNLTTGVMSFINSRMIETTDFKRNSYGEDGMCKFFETMLTGLDNAGVFTGGKGLDVSVMWSNYFNPSEDELSTKTQRLQVAVGAGFTTQEYAVKSLALAEGCTDVDELVEEAAKEFEAKKAEQDAESQAQHENAKDLVETKAATAPKGK